jgi:hypothetical protein
MPTTIARKNFGIFRFAGERPAPHSKGIASKDRIRGESGVGIHGTAEKCSGGCTAYCQVSSGVAPILAAVP